VVGHRRRAGRGRLRSRRTRLRLARSIVDYIPAERGSDLTVLARLERVANRFPANHVGSAHPDAGRNCHPFNWANRWPDAASDFEAHPSPHASADRQTDPNSAACEHIDPAWLTDE
jgi:hypothetical protein